MPAFPEAAKIALADTQLRRNLAHATHVIRTKRDGVVGELDDWQELRLAGAAIKDRTLRHLDALPGEVRGRGARRGRAGALGPGRGRGQRDRRRPGAAGRRRRGGQGQVHGHPGDGHERGAGRSGHRRARDRPGRADRPAQRRPAQPHPGAGDPPQPGRDPGDLPARDAGRAGRPHRRAAGAGRGGADAPAAQVHVGEGRDLGRELRDRRDRDAGRRRVRGQRADVPDPARDTDQRGRRGEDPADVAATWRCSCSCCPARRPGSG